MPCYVSAINCNGYHRGVKNCSASRVAKLTVSTGRRVAGMLYRVCYDTIIKGFRCFFVG